MSAITLTSDIGLQDYLVGTMKGILYDTVPQQLVIDISHEITPFNFPQAAYICQSAFPRFPQGSYHFILVNLLTKHEEPFLLCKHKGQYFFCANNGLLSMILNESPEEMIQITGIDTKNTLDIVHRFATLVAKLEKGCKLEDLGTPVQNFEERKPLEPIIQEDHIEGKIIYIDRFENVIVNITRTFFERARRGRSFKINVMRDDYITKIHNRYTDVPAGGKIAFFNTSGYLEIAINKGNAAGLFGLKSYTQNTKSEHTHFRNQMFYQTIRIYFE